MLGKCFAIRAFTIAASIVFSCLVVRAQDVPDQKERTWTDALGNTIKAKYIRVLGPDVLLQRGGKAVQVPFIGLGTDDQKYVRDLLKAGGKLGMLPPRDMSRTWTTKTMRTFQGGFVRVLPETQKVLVIMPNGLPQETPFDTLNLEDRNHVRALLTAYGEAELVKSREKEEEEEKAAADAVEKARQDVEAKKQAAEEAKRKLEEEQRARVEMEKRLRDEEYQRQKELRDTAHREELRRIEENNRLMRERMQPRPSGPIIIPPPQPTPGSISGMPGTQPRASGDWSTKVAAGLLGLVAMLACYLLIMGIFTCLATLGLKLASHVILGNRPLDMIRACEMATTVTICYMFCHVTFFVMAISFGQTLPAMFVLLLIPLGLTMLCFPSYHYAEKCDIHILHAFALWLFQLLITTVFMVPVMALLAVLAPIVFITLRAAMGAMRGPG